MKLDNVYIIDKSMNYRSMNIDFNKYKYILIDGYASITLYTDSVMNISLLNKSMYWPKIGGYVNDQRSMLSLDKHLVGIRVCGGMERLVVPSNHVVNTRLFGTIYPSQFVVMSSNILAKLAEQVTAGYANVSYITYTDFYDRYLSIFESDQLYINKKDIYIDLSKYPKSIKGIDTITFDKNDIYSYMKINDFIIALVGRLESDEMYVDKLNEMRKLINITKYLI